MIKKLHFTKNAQHVVQVIRIKHMIIAPLFKRTRKMYIDKSRYTQG